MPMRRGGVAVGVLRVVMGKVYAEAPIGLCTIQGSR